MSDVCLAFAKSTIAQAGEAASNASAINQEQALSWYRREQLRTVEGILDRIVVECVELIHRDGSDEADAFLESYYKDNA